MTMIFRILLAMLLLACLASFGWGMSRFFVKPKQATLGMKVTATAGLTSALLHFRAILFAHQISVARFSVSAVMYVVAVSLFWWAIRVNRARPLAACFSGSGTPGLNTSGPYRLMRHPFYCSYLLAWFSGMIATEWTLLPTVIVMFTIYMMAALREEEQYERGPLAQGYRLYCSRTGRFFPKLWKLNASHARGEARTLRAPAGTLRRALLRSRRRARTRETTRTRPMPASPVRFPRRRTDNNGNVSGSAWTVALNGTGIVLTAIAITAPNTTLSSGETQQFAATGT